jgi:hypothetical protein
MNLEERNAGYTGNRHRRQRYVQQRWRSQNDRGCGEAERKQRQQCHARHRAIMQRGPKR